MYFIHTVYQEFIQLCFTKNDEDYFFYMIFSSQEEVQAELFSDNRKYNGENIQKITIEELKYYMKAT